MGTHVMGTSGEELPVYENNIPESFEMKYVSQKDWGLGELLAFYVGGVGAGLYVLSQFMNFVPGLIVGFVLVVFGKNIAHLISASRPANAFRALTRPGTSWISRGAYFILFFAIFGILDIASRAGWIAGGGMGGKLLSALAFISALLVMIYLGFLLSASRVIPLWNSPLLPAIFLSYSLTLGGALEAILYPITGTDYSIVFLTKLLLLTISATLFLVLVHLMVMSSSSKAAKRSAHLLLKGALKSTFVGGVLVAGLIVPFAITGISHLAQSSTGAWTVLAGILVLGGGFLYEKALLKAAVYLPMMDVSS
jgi:formate-dependent nitrite reductase membrane component NrfD